MRRSVVLGKAANQRGIVPNVARGIEVKLVGELKFALQYCEWFRHPYPSTIVRYERDMFPATVFTVASDEQ